MLLFQTLQPSSILPEFQVRTLSKHRKTCRPLWSPKMISLPSRLSIPCLPIMPSTDPVLLDCDTSKTGRNSASFSTDSPHWWLALSGQHRNISWIGERTSQSPTNSYVRATENFPLPRLLFLNPYTLLLLSLQQIFSVSSLRHTSRALIYWR